MKPKDEVKPGTETPAATPATPTPAVPPEVSADIARLQEEAAAAQAASPEAKAQEMAVLVKKTAIEEGADFFFDVLDPVVNKLVLARAPVPEDQFRTLCHAYSAVIEKRWPGSLDEYGPEVAAVVLTLTLIAPRVIAIRKVEAQERADAEKKDAA